MVRSRLTYAALAAAVSLTFVQGRPGAVVVAAQSAAAPSVDPAALNLLRWRSVGPSRGGRVVAVAGDPVNKFTFYQGTTGGGVWKTDDGGLNWVNVSDGFFHAGSVGAIQVAPSNPNVIYVGMGEGCIRGNASYGDGVYKSTDAGKTWTHMGLEATRQTGRLQIHPTNPDIVYVAAFGLYHGPSDERGVFKSSDGGKTWKKTLFRDGKTGAVDLSIDRKNPNVMYAALWEAYRVEYQMSSGGPGSVLFKSTDGGETWTEITRNPGLPTGMVGRIGVAVSGADGSRVYALVENENGGLFVSDDAGATWKLMNAARSVRQRAFYYTHVYADPTQKDVVYMQNTSLFRSSDAGKTLVSIGNGTHGDHHDLWIDPDNANHVMDGNDGGGAITFNVAAPARQVAWSDQDFPTAQFYHVTTTAHVPFHLCGSQQDNTTLCTPSDTNLGGGFGRIPPVASYQVGGGEPGYIAPHPSNEDLFFAGTNNGGFLTRYNKRTGELKEVGAYPRFFSGEASKDVKERWQWTYPIIFAYADPTVLYTTSQRVWKSTNGGDSWEAISGDITRHDPKTMQDSGGPITHDMNSPEIYGTVFSLGPGKKDVNLIWAGSDDGLIQVTRDGGKSWTRIVTGLDSGSTINVVREDPKRKGLLYAGSETKVWVSFDDGDHWQKFANGLPDVPVTDLWVSGTSLAAATHGRSFYVMDNLGTLRQFAGSLGDVTLFAPPDTIRGLDRVLIDYYLKAQPKTLTLEILDASGAVVRTFTGQPPRPAGQAAGGGDDDEGPRGPATTVPMAAGMNRASWDLSAQPVLSFPGMILWGATQSGPTVLPGKYQVRLTADGVTQSQPFTLVKHPRRDISDADLQYQWDLATRIRDKVNEANASVVNIRRIKTEVAEKSKGTPKEVVAAAEALTKSLTAVEVDLYQVKNQSGQDPLNFPIRTNNRLASLLRVAITGEGRPTSNVVPIFDELQAELKAEQDRLDKVLASELVTLNRMLTREKKTPVSPK
jgi:photosystem II stability/assembly factor-like uncharacterized protein